MSQIYGIGADITQISRIAATLARSKGRLAEKVLGPEEMAVYHARGARNENRGLAFLATRFAAKEACSKALGLGMRWPMSWRYAQILNLPSGKPYIKLSGELGQCARARGIELQVSVSDEKDYVVAYVIATTAAVTQGTASAQPNKDNASDE
ncbi:MAG: holo-ACP synthase [Candidatus Protistobacter heckmanni]|nr:holo-ACP synthase [Candidatus Protistobacter heckmanni]